MAATKDYYQLLGVPETASLAEIKKAFRRLAKQHHPDRNPDKPQAAERFKEINEAHDVLSNAEKRQKYDQLRRYGAVGSAPGYARETSGTAPPGFGPDFDASDLGSVGGLGDLFSSIFGRRGDGRGADGDEEVETTVSIPFRVAARGGKVPVALPLAEVCPTCTGSGAAPGAKISTCSECRGRGTVSFGQGGFTVNRPCPVCRGRGRIPSEPCPTCDGSGEVRVDKRLLITVPPGTEDGGRVRLRGQGAKGRGDVVVVFRVEPDRFFQREGLDIICIVPINVAQAILGSKIKVNTLEGRHIVLRIPGGTQHGQRFRITGHGIERAGRRGDQYVEVRVTIPENLTPEELEAARAFAEKAGIKY